MDVLDVCLTIGMDPNLPNKVSFFVCVWLYVCVDVT